MHSRLLRRRFTGTIRRIDRAPPRGELSDAQACAQMSHTLRSFLHQATGSARSIMHVDEIGAGDARAGGAADRRAERRAVRHHVADADPEDLGATAEELIRSWT